MDCNPLERNTLTFSPSIVVQPFSLRDVGRQPSLHPSAHFTP